MTSNFSRDKLRYFFSDFDEKNSILILFFIIFSLSLYVIYWLYSINKKLVEIDDDAPDSDRAVTVLLILPSLWFLISYYFKRYVFEVPSSYLLKIYWDPYLNSISTKALVIGIVEFLVWLLIIFIILKYFYDFCKSYNNLTNTGVFIWYIFLSSEVFAFIFLLLGMPYMLFLSFFTIITIPAMQEKLNMMSSKSEIYAQNKLTYKYGTNG